MQSGKWRPSPGDTAYEGCGAPGCVSCLGTLRVQGLKGCRVPFESTLERLGPPNKKERQIAEEGLEPLSDNDKWGGVDWIERVDDS